jgi:hypothetical protein
MKNDQVTCAICGEQRQDEDGWFVLVENRWTDRLKILVWNEALASAVRHIWLAEPPTCSNWWCTG